MPSRSTKDLAALVDADYFRRPRPLQRWTRRLTAAVVVASLAWVGSVIARRDNRVFSSGPVSTRHAIFGRRCTECHVQAFRPVADAACTRCHEGPPHPVNDRVMADFPPRGMPACRTCHVEHRNAPVLAAVTDRHCTQCHDDVRRTGQWIRGLGSGHPEFPDWARPAKPAPAGNYKYNLSHKTHMHLSRADVPPELRGFTGLTCESCHEPDQTRALMKPVNYDRHCKACHPLTVPPPRFGAGRAAAKDLVAPHGEPVMVVAFLLARSTEYAARLGRQPEAAPTRTPPIRRRLPERIINPLRSSPAEPQAEAPNQWLRDAKQNVFFRGVGGAACTLCHRLIRPPSDAGVLAAPRVVPTDLPASWMPHAVFSHKPHRALGCTECHAGATTSSDPAEMLLPAKDLCTKCHTARGGARSGCVECHLYHARSEHHGALTIKDLEGARP